MIPKEIINRILDTANIVDVVGEYIRLQRKGANYVGLCPFHNEKTPSFTVSPTKNIFKCFGCGKSGNPINFLMEYNSLTYLEAIKELANKYNIPIPKDSSIYSKESSDKIDLMYAALDDAAKFFNNKLFENEGIETLKYFKNRNFDINTIATFLLGYAPDNYNELINFLKKKNYSNDILVNNGIVYLSEKNDSLIPRFRNRAIFPIRDFVGRVIGFGARYLGEDKNQAKYINSPQNEIYDKSRVLYGIFESKNEIRNKGFAILVEGYADVISLFQKGIRNVVATSGTALTTQQVKLLSRFTNKIYICYDGDEAGQKASESAAELALINGLDVKIITLPDTDDPDTFINNNTVEKFEKYIDNSKTFIKFKISRLKKQNLLSTPLDLSNAIKSIINVIYRIPDELQHDFYINELASELNLSTEQIKKIKDSKSSILKNIEKEDNITKNINLDEANKEIANFKYKLEDLLPEEKFLAKLVINNSENLLHLFEYTNFSYDMLITKTAKKIFELLANYSESKFILNEILSYESDDNLKKLFIDLSIEQETPSENWSKMLNLEITTPNTIKIITDCVNKLQIRNLENHFKELKILVAKEPDNPIHIQRLNKIIKRINELKSTI